MKKLFSLLLAGLLLPSVAAFGQEALPDKETYRPVPWTKAISAGLSIWPTTKERFRLAYHWQPKQNTEWVHELAYIEAIHEIFDWNEGSNTDRYGVLRGAQLKNELRFYHKKTTDGPAYWYHGLGLAYMYTTHDLQRGMECDEWNEWNGCAYFQRFDDLVAHTGTLTGTFGVVLRAGGVVNFNFYGSLGLRGSYFPEATSMEYFGSGPLIVNSKHVLLLPHAKVAANIMFVLSKRKQ